MTDSRRTAEYTSLVDNIGSKAAETDLAHPETWASHVREIASNLHAPSLLKARFQEEHPHDAPFEEYARTQVCKHALVAADAHALYLLNVDYVVLGDQTHYLTEEDLNLDPDTTLANTAKRFASPSQAAHAAQQYAAQYAAVGIHKVVTLHAIAERQSFRWEKEEIRQRLIDLSHKRQSQREFRDL